MDCSENCKALESCCKSRLKEDNEHLELYSGIASTFQDLLRTIEASGSPELKEAGTESFKKVMSFCNRGMLASFKPAHHDPLNTMTVRTFLYALRDVLPTEEEEEFYAEG